MSVANDQGVTTKAARPKKSIARCVFTLVAVAICLACAYATFAAQSQLRVLNSRLTHEQTTNANLQNELGERVQRELVLRIRESQFSDLERVVRDSYGEIGDVLAFPPNDSPFVITSTVENQFFGDTLHLSVPRGKHRLLLRFTRTSSSGQEFSSKKLSYDLAGSAGYIVRLHFMSDPEEINSRQQSDTEVSEKLQDLKLTIESSDTQYKPVATALIQQIPARRTPGGGATVGRVFLPNHAYPERDDHVVLLCADWGYTNESGEQELWVFKAMLESDGPDLVAPQHVSYLNSKYLEFSADAEFGFYKLHSTRPIAESKSEDE